MLKYFKSLKIRFMFWQDFDDAIAAENNVRANDNLSESGSTVPDWLRRVSWSFRFNFLRVGGGTRTSERKYC